MRTIILLIPFLLFSTYLSAQQLVGTTGSSVKNNEFEVSYAIGELAINTFSATDNIITQGLLQPNIRIVNSDCQDLLKSLLYYPNPARNELRISTQYLGISHYQIFAADGRLMASDVFNYTPIDVSKLASGFYVIRLFTSCDNSYRAIKFLKQ